MNISFENSRASGTDTWFTPPEIVKALGKFDLDPCTSVNRPWDTADSHYTIEDDGLSKPWLGRVWCNPPYGYETEKWGKKMAEHKMGVLLIFARPDTKVFHNIIFPLADGILFTKGRISFYRENGIKAKSAGCGSCFVTFNGWDTLILNSLLNKSIISGHIFCKQQLNWNLKYKRYGINYDALGYLPKLELSYRLGLQNELGGGMNETS